MKLGVVGSREFNDYDLLSFELSKFSNISLIISGGASGADSLAERYAAETLIPVKIFLPDYKVFGRSAPLKRNTQIVEASDFVIAFWDGRSTGTKDSINKAKRFNKPLKIVYYTLNDLGMEE